MLCSVRPERPVLRLRSCLRAQDSWVQWWTLVARVSCTCSTSRHATLGPQAGELWRYFSLNDDRFLDPNQPLGLRRLLCSQAHHAYRALVCAGVIGVLTELTATAAALTSLQELVLMGYPGPRAACIAAALGSSPSRVSLPGSALWVCLSPQTLQRVTHLHVDEAGSLSAADLTGMAGRLPHLQELTLSVSPISGYPAHVLSRLSLLPAVRLHLEQSLNEPSAATLALQQLSRSGVLVQSLRIEGRSGDELTPEGEELLARCNICAS